MIFSSIFSGLMQVVFKPQILLPLIILVLASFAVTQVSGFVLERPLTDFALYASESPADNLLGIFLFNYPLEILGMVLIGSIMFGIGVIALMSVARMTKGSRLVESVNISVLEIEKTIGLIILFWVIFIIIGGAFTLASVLSAINSTIGLIVMLIFAIIIFITIVKLIFTIPALIGKQLKKALQESWKFTNKKFWGAVLLILVSGLITFIISMIFSEIGLIISGTIETSETVEIILTALGEVIGTTFFIAAVTNYFYSKQA